MTLLLPSSQIPYLPLHNPNTYTLKEEKPSYSLYSYSHCPSITLTSPNSLSIMATKALMNSLHYNHSLKLQPSSEATPPSSFFLKPTTTNSLSLSITTTSSSTTTTPTATTIFSLSPATSSSSSSSSSSATPSTSQTFSLDLLQQHLSTQDFRQADEETRRLLIFLAGEAAQKRGYVFFSEVQFISEKDLKAIDDLWRKHSNNRFGYSVQKRIWQQKAKKDFTQFFLKVGWMKKLATEVEQYNYRSFPNEFIWELNGDTPEGHLPLTNALRGTQLLNSILNHPAFDGDEEEEEDEEDDDDEVDAKGLKDGSKPLSKSVFKPDYSF